MYLCNAVPEGGVEGGGGEDDLGEHGGGLDGAAEADPLPVAGDAVQRLRPPLVGGDVEAGDGGGVVDELLDFLIEREPRDEILGPGRNGQTSVAEWQRIS